MNNFEDKTIQVLTLGGNTRIGERYEVGLKIAADYGYVDDAKIIINQQGGTNEREIKMNYVSTENNMNYFSCVIPFESTGLHYFCFKLVINKATTFIKNDVKHKCACITNKHMPYWTITVYENNFYVPEWAKNKIMYQIFPDRFYRSANYTPQKIEGRDERIWGDMPEWDFGENKEKVNTDYFMGNLKGIEEKLDYLKGLGVEIIYMNPICLSQSNHRYDAADYTQVDPYLGTNESLKSLCTEAHKRGMHIILDGVFNHVGNDSIYFNQYNTYNTVGAFAGPASPYYEWFRRDKNGEVDCWWGFKNLRVWNAYNQNFRNYICGEGGVIDNWFSLGVDGVRLDVADELPDDFIENIRVAVKRNKPDGFIIGEVWDNAITKEGYGRQRTYLLGKGLDSVMNYPFTNAILKYVRFGRFDVLADTINEILNQYPKEVQHSLMNSLSTHDITRAITTLSAEGVQDSRFGGWIWDVPYSRQWQYAHNTLSQETYLKGKSLMKVATTIQYFLPGNPCIYYGDEAGLYGYKDPFNRKCFPWENIDNDLYLFFVNLAKARQKCTNLLNSEMKILEINKEYFMFERYTDNGGVLIAVNRSEGDVTIDIPQKYKEGETLFELNVVNNNFSKYGILIKSSK